MFMMQEILAIANRCSRRLALLPVVLLLAGACGYAQAQHEPSLPASAAPAAKAASSQDLAVLPSSGVKLLGKMLARYDFGTVDALDSPQVTRDFVLRNDGKKPVHLDHFQPSCGCTSAAVLGDANSSTSNIAAPALPTLAPGATVTVRVTVDTGLIPSGPATKEILVYAASASQPAAILQMTGLVRSAITFTPAVVAFGRVAVGQVKSMPLTITLDARAAPDGVPPLISSNPFFKITSSPSDAGKRSSAKALSRHYTITLAANAPVGRVMGTLFFAAAPFPSGGRPSPKTLKAMTPEKMRAMLTAADHPSAADRTFRNHVVLVTGQVAAGTSAELPDTRAVRQPTLPAPAIAPPTK